MEEIRCPFCNQKLMEADYVKAEIKCVRCKRILKIKYPKDRVKAAR